MKKYLYTLLVLAIIVALALALTRSNGGALAVPNTSSDTSAVATSSLPTLENYIRANISDLSPVKETLGGKFIVTKYTAAKGGGTVYYEDGHNAYVADFTYILDDQKRGMIDTFVVRK